jgi:hypothetical protein
VGQFDPGGLAMERTKDGKLADKVSPQLVVTIKKIPLKKKREDRHRYRSRRRQDVFEIV